MPGSKEERTLDEVCQRLTPLVCLDHYDRASRATIRRIVRSAATSSTRVSARVPALLIQQLLSAFRSAVTLVRRARTVYSRLTEKAIIRLYWRQRHEVLVVPLTERAWVIGRYTRPEMGEVWSDERKYAYWLKVETAVCEAWFSRGRIPDEAMASIRQATCDLGRMREIEAEVDHDLIAFLRATGESVGDAARFMHLGLTSSDVVDTALALQVVAAGELIDRGLGDLIEVVGRQAVSHRATLMIGRTHGMHAEPTTFGLKLAVWYDELRRHRTRLDLARHDMAVGKISGAVGTHAHVPPDLEAEVCAVLGLVPAPASTQIIQRDRHAFFLSVLAGIGGTLEKIAVEIRHLQRSEVREVEERFDPGNQGSSAMPHKRNPHASERIAGLSRLLRGYAVTGFENVALWHERDISHSSTERVVFPDACCVLDFMLAEATDLIDRLVIYPNRMQANFEAGGGVVYSQPVMLALVDAGMDRQEAYRLVQRHAYTAWDGGTPLRVALESDPVASALLSPVTLDQLFDPTLQLQHVDAVFDRLGLLPALVEA